MKKHIALGVALLLTIGSAVAGTFLYGQEQSATDIVQITLPSDNDAALQTVTPEMIAMWKANAASTDYEAPKAPI